MPDSSGKSALPVSYSDVALSMKNVRAEEGGKETTGKTSVSIRPSKGLGERSFLMGDGGGGEEFLSFSSLPFSLPYFPFCPETPDTQANEYAIFKISSAQFILRI